ncbi:hypothetical protein LCGC14_1181360 [marine sediment metagenome]|uniref:Uncharacterized protein n=1 Tax=marine sediment metagenome TaxID=412755 RepID=A0A0F9M9S0_9ZZZZ
MSTRKPTAKQVLKAALEEAAGMNNANARVEAKVDALCKFVLSQK